MQVSSNLQHFSCLCLHSVGFSDVCHHTQLYMSFCIHLYLIYSQEFHHPVHIYIYIFSYIFSIESLCLVDFLFLPINFGLNSTLSVIRMATSSWLPFARYVDFHSLTLVCGVFGSEGHFLETTGSWILFLTVDYQSTSFNWRAKAIYNQSYYQRCLLSPVIALVISVVGCTIFHSFDFLLVLGIFIQCQ